MDFLRKLFDTSDYPARWNCGNWGDFEGWLHIISDTAIWGAYFVIPIILFYFMKTLNGELPKFVRRVLPFFIAFILSCGAGHLMDAIIFYYPAYRFLGILKAITAIVSWATVFALLPIFPRFFKLRTQDEFDEMIEKHEEIKKEKEEVENLLEESKRTKEQIIQKLKELELELKKSE